MSAFELTSISFFLVLVYEAPSIPAYQFNTMVPSAHVVWQNAIEIDGPLEQ